MHWERVAKVLGAARTVVLTLAGFALLSLAAYLAHPVAGYATMGVSLLLIEALTGEDRAARR